MSGAGAKFTNAYWLRAYDYLKAISPSPPRPLLPYLPLCKGGPGGFLPASPTRRSPPPTPTAPPTPSAAPPRPPGTRCSTRCAAAWCMRPKKPARTGRRHPGLLRPRHRRTLTRVMQIAFAAAELAGVSDGWMSRLRTNRPREMASRRAIRRKACKGKQRATTRKRPRGEGILALRRRGVLDWLTPYRCAFCNGFHFGHPPAR
ncbi:MAG: hypothetical protein M5R42_16715 [Rhodocyclaceae bacterium]|nr:hypothetical protein [Rhodocyclaceae bacterium]